MFQQTGQHPFHEPEPAGLALPGLRGGEARDTPSMTPGLPSFLSADPPRSEGEALLRRIFSRSGWM